MHSAERVALLVTYYFPPSGGSGVQRMLKFTKYLPHFGWKPLILTVREDAEFPARDETLRSDIPEGTKVVRTGITEFYRFYRSMAGTTAPLDVSARSENEGLLKRFLRAVRASIFVPDGRVGWIPHALGPGKKLAVENNASVILSSGPPFTANLIGGLLHRRTGLPWMQDFRDPWTRAPFYPDRPALVRRIDERLEAWTVRTADRTLAVNRMIIDDFCERYERIDRDRLATLPNGYDEEDFEGLERSDPKKLTMVHTGSLFSSRDPKALRTALADLCAQEEGFAESVEIVIAGRVDPDVEEALRAPPLDRIVSLVGYLEHSCSLKLLRSAHLCLLFVGQEKSVRGMLTGKVFEYLGSGTPILAIAPEGEARDLIERCRAGFVVDPTDVEGTRELLRSIWKRFQSGERRFGEPDRDAIAGYGRRALTGRLAEILASVADEPRPKR